MSRSRQSSVVSGQPDLHVVAILRGEERYVVLYDDANKEEARRVVQKWASHPELSFTWYDAACVAQRIRQAKSGGA